MKNHWSEGAIFYHIYPLGSTGAPRSNDAEAPVTARLEQLYGWLDHIQSLGANALYLGPLFESKSHGYDTLDYFQVDRRLGSRETLAALSAELHRRGMRLVLDAVFNHVSREHWAFRDVLAHGANSPYAGWFHLDFSRQSPYHDPFTYQRWDGHYSLVKLNTSHPGVRQHLFEAVKDWVNTYDIDGLRLDAADVMAPAFLSALAQHCHDRKPDLWLMGELVQGDYTRLVNSDTLDSCTNYITYKGLYSSFNDHNLFEIAHTLRTYFGEGAPYQRLRLYNFADNHDVDRVAASLREPAHLHPLHLLLFSMPGIPSIYYGSEWGWQGKRTPHSDQELRPAIDIRSPGSLPHPELAETIRRMAALRRELPALRLGGYRELLVASEQLAFLRTWGDEMAVVVVNAGSAPAQVDIDLPGAQGSLVDRLNPGSSYPMVDGRCRITDTAPDWGRVLRLES
jgi:glycosidase